ncbi:Bud site selection protein, Revert to axial protein 1 [Saitozyma podzolica]|uniref:Bud site selection protein, Revert to axial protein 1 n=1 Tax=Saitozyma podzolica TaxID=1890683 RepID=A0A427YFZ9_9TREE|nr:Bud site selection protein, Revert to axial protein 1 [Saitozyma podzolica]
MDEKAPAPVDQTTTKEQRRLSTTRYLKLNRLPTLQEVLDRRTRPPLDLFCFYIFLQRESAEDALDFWLDVQQHENMCKAYFKASRPCSTLTLGATFTNSPPARRSSEIYPSPGATSAAAAHDAPSPPSLSVRDRRDTESHGGQRSPSSPLPHMGEMGFAQQQQQGHQLHQGSEQTGAVGAGPGGRMSMRGRWGERRSKAPTILARDKAIEKAALVESAERIYLRYLLPGAEREIYLPPSLRLSNFPISSGSDASPLIPDLFHAQKVYIFKALEQDAFPRFLRAKAFSNLTPLSSFVRLIAGLFVLWGAFVLGFSLIFLDYKPKVTRLWIILPFFVATNLLLAAYYSLDPLLALLQQSETTPFRFIRVREVYVRKLIGLRAMWIEAVCVVLTAVLTVIFALVPGHRL